MSFAQAETVAEKVIGLFEQGEFDVCTLFYSEFKSVISQVPTAQQLIPASSSAARRPQTHRRSTTTNRAPRKSSRICCRAIKVQIFRALLENVAGEMGAKMSAMDNATRNAGEMIDKLSMSYNRQRQAQITKELIEIISGAEAL
jgi:F-type H+-transporting ATPase subunit gamma